MPKRDFSDVEGLAVFEKPAKKRLLQKSRIASRATTSTLSNDKLDTLLFEIPRSGKQEYIDINATKIQLQLQIVDKEGEALKAKGNVQASSQVSFIQNGFHSLFENVNVSLNHKPITTPDNHYMFSR